MSTNKRNEGQLLCDVIGLESYVPLAQKLDRGGSLTDPSLVDDITYRKAAEATNSATASAVLGPFWRHDTPIRKFGSSITFNTPADGQVAYIHGAVTDAKSKKPIANALVDVWLASTNGKYVIGFRAGAC